MFHLETIISETLKTTTLQIWHEVQEAENFWFSSKISGLEAVVSQGWNQVIKKKKQATTLKFWFGC